MSRRCQHNHHRPAVFKERWTGRWAAECECGYRSRHTHWRSAWIDALAHSQVIS